jgi:hypothetical protein
MRRLKGLKASWLCGMLVAVVLTSCAHQKAYLEPALGVDQIAILDARLPIWIVSIDGAKVSSWGSRDSMSVKLLPGPHVVKVVFQQSGIGHVRDRTTLQLRYSRTYGDRPIDLELEAKAGCKYFIEHRVEDGRSAQEKFWKVWIAKLDSV